jgi:thymidylate kinase
MSLIILEGADGNGKTTLLKQLQRDTNLPIFYSGGPKTSEVMFNMLEGLEKRAEEEQTYLCDRVPFISEIVYSSSMGRQPVIGITELMDYWNLPIKVIYCRLQNSDEALANMSRETKAHKPLEHTKNVEKYYDNIVEGYDYIMENMEKQGVDVFEYDWKNPEHYAQLMEWL